MEETEAPKRNSSPKAVLASGKPGAGAQQERAPRQVTPLEQRLEPSQVDMMMEESGPWGGQVSICIENGQ